jgi:hypothetical protein
MNALVTGEAKLKLALSDHICGLSIACCAQADEPSCQQGGGLGSTLLCGHHLGWVVVDFMHWLPILSVQLAQGKIVSGGHSQCQEGI